MIAIINQKKDKDDKALYWVQINNKFVCEFYHKREDGLGMCLLEASKAVEKSKWLNIIESFNHGR